MANLTFESWGVLPALTFELWGVLPALTIGGVLYPQGSNEIYVSNFWTDPGGDGDIFACINSNTQPYSVLALAQLDGKTLELKNVHTNEDLLSLLTNYNGYYPIFVIQNNENWVIFANVNGGQTAYSFITIYSSIYGGYKIPTLYSAYFIIANKDCTFLIVALQYTVSLGYIQAYSATLDLIGNLSEWSDVTPQYSMSAPEDYSIEGNFNADIFGGNFITVLIDTVTTGQTLVLYKAYYVTGPLNNIQLLNRAQPGVYSNSSYKQQQQSYYAFNDFLENTYFQASFDNSYALLISTKIYYPDQYLYAAINNYWSSIFKNNMYVICAQSLSGLLGNLFYRAGLKAQGGTDPRGYYFTKNHICNPNAQPRKPR